MNRIILSLSNRIHMFVYNYLYLTLTETDGLAGGAGFAIDSSANMDIHFSTTDCINAQHSPVLRFYCEKMKKFVSYSGGISITVDKQMDEHIGYGSTISLVTAMLYGMNVLFDSPLSEADIRNLIFKYYCEDVGGKLEKGFDTGVGAVCSLRGGINFVRSADEYYHMSVPDNYCVLAFVPQRKQFEKKLSIEYEHKRLKKLYDSEISDWSEKVRYIDSRLIPDMKVGNLRKFGEDILRMHQIGSKRVECEEYDYNLQMEIINHLLSCGGCIAGLSSAGPSNFVVVDENNVASVVSGIRRFCPSGSLSKFHISNNGLEIMS